MRPVTAKLTEAQLRTIQHIYTLEKIGSLESDLGELLGEPVEFGRFQTEGQKIPLSDLSREQMEFLIDYYKADYELMCEYYTTEALWKEWEKS